VAVTCEHGNEPSGAVRGGEFLDQLSDWWLRKDSAPWSLLKYVYCYCKTIEYGGLSDIHWFVIWRNYVQKCGSLLHAHC
jgi:hypothetical protein